jgi:4-amino-4-deoxy-L-arabinose transferase-like glycosyltransferase
MISLRNQAATPALDASCPAPAEHLQRAMVVVVLVSASLALLVTAPASGNFSWSDAPRHALNGAFVKDLIAAFPWHDPRSWAIGYYMRYPALTIVFYPPLFYFVEAVVFAIVGVTNWAAQVTVTLFTLLLAFAAYGFARFALPRWSSVAVALLAIGAPEVAYWGRQVMLDIPAYATLVTSVYFFVRYLEQNHRRDIYLTALFVLAAIYTKLGSAFIAPVLAATFVVARGRNALRDRDAIWAALLAAVGVIPALLMTLHFGAVNVESVAGRSIDLPRASLGAWIFYARQMPRYLGPVGAMLACVGFVLLVLRRIGPTQRWFALLLIAWLGFGYLFYSTIDVRLPRHGLAMVLPLVVCAVLVLHRVLPDRIAQAAAMVLGLGTLGYSLAFDSPPVINGYDQVTDYVAQHAPKDAVIVFAGYRDGNFIFDLRTHEERRDIATLRADKLLLSIAVERVRGVEQKTYDEAAIAQMLRDYGVSLVVAQPGFWTDLEEMRRFEAVLHTPNFTRVAQFDITGTEPHDDNSIEIYQPTYPVTQSRNGLQLDMPIIGRKFQGQIQ